MIVDFRCMIFIYTVEMDFAFKQGKINLKYVISQKLFKRFRGRRFLPQITKD